MEAATLIQLALQDSILAMEFASMPVLLVEISINSQEIALIAVTLPTTTWPTEVASEDQSPVQQDNGKLTTLATTSPPLATPSIPIQDSASPASATFIKETLTELVLSLLLFALRDNTQRDSSVSPLPSNASNSTLNLRNAKPALRDTMLRMEHARELSVLQVRCLRTTVSSA